MLLFSDSNLEVNKIMEEEKKYYEGNEEYPTWNDLTEGYINELSKKDRRAGKKPPQFYLNCFSFINSRIIKYS